MMNILATRLCASPEVSLSESMLEWDHEHVQRSTLTVQYIHPIKDYTCNQRGDTNVAPRDSRQWPLTIGDTHGARQDLRNTSYSFTHLDCYMYQCVTMSKVGLLLLLAFIFGLILHLHLPPPRSRGQQAKQSSPATLSGSSWGILRRSQASWDILSLQRSSRLPRCLLPLGRVWKTSDGRRPGGILTRLPEATSTGPFRYEGIAAPRSLLVSEFHL